MSLAIGGVIFPDKATEALLRANGHADAVAGKDKDDGWGELCQEMGWDRWKQRLLHERYNDGWYEGAIQKKAA